MNIQLRNDRKGMRLVGSPELTPSQAVELVNALLQACAECGEPMAVQSGIQASVQAQVTDQIRQMAAVRAERVVMQLIERKLTPSHAAQTIVDIVLSAVQGRIVH